MSLTTKEKSNIITNNLIFLLDGTLLAFLFSLPQQPVEVDIIISSILHMNKLRFLPVVAQQGNEEAKRT